MEKCDLCYGYGFWTWGQIVPMSSMDASDGIPTFPCPACGANPNPPRDTSDAYDTEADYQKYLDWYNDMVQQMKEWYQDQQMKDVQTAQDD